MEGGVRESENSLSTAETRPCNALLEQREPQDIAGLQRATATTNSPGAARRPANYETGPFGSRNLSSLPDRPAVPADPGDDG
jgi:hypothetical protein